MKALRGERDLSQEDLAHLAGVTAKTVWRMERGERVADRTRRRVARVLGVPVEELFVVVHDEPGPGEASSAKRHLTGTREGA